MFISYNFFCDTLLISKTIKKNFSFDNNLRYKLVEN